MDNEFFNRDAEIVARELLGKILVRNINGKEKKARIVETEAYYDEKDPASRACKNGDLKETMKMDAGTILVYGVHNNWLINFVTGKEGEAAAVLIRALEPINFKSNCSGPGLLTKSLGIDKSLHKKHIFDNKGYLDLTEGDNNHEVAEAFRIGVKKDLPRKLRFYIKDNKFVSRR
ncbi:MAG: DNA-3-methyladenine glycosylase [Nanoarchaeota archaeon]|nr:DNA-3-methyladenine glycosylase [Nanoarchaeota archaeon]